MRGNGQMDLMFGGKAVGLSDFINFFLISLLLLRVLEFLTRGESLNLNLLPSDRHWSKSGSGTDVASRIQMFNF
jgi:hypothetical protein